MVKEVFNELKPSKQTAQEKAEERWLRAELRRNLDADYCGFNKDGDDGTKEVENFRNVEREGEERAFGGCTPIAGGWVVLGLDEVTEFW